MFDAFEPKPSNRWFDARAGQNIGYPLDLTPIPVPGGGTIGDLGDSIAEVSLAIRPSGTGEIQAVDLSVNGLVITAQLSGGVAGREYVVAIAVTMLAGRIFNIPVYLPLSRVLETYPRPDPPSRDFGAPITWSSGATVFGPAIAAVANGLIGTGTNQATALVLPAQTNGIASAPPGTGFILPGIVSGTIVVQDDDPVNNAAIYPPVGAQINALAVNAPFIVGANRGRINFSTQSSTTQWIAG